MSPIVIALLVGWLIFIIVGLIWFLFQALQSGWGRKPTPPSRNTLYRTLFVVTNLIWLSLIGALSGLKGDAPIDLDDLACFWIIMVPSMGFAIVMAHLIDQKRIRRMLTDQESEGKDRSKIEG